MQDRFAQKVMLCLVEFRMDNYSLLACLKWCSERHRILHWIIGSRLPSVAARYGAALISWKHALLHVWQCSFWSHTGVLIEAKIEDLPNPELNFNLVQHIALILCCHSTITFPLYGSLSLQGQDLQFFGSRRKRVSSRVFASKPAVWYRSGIE